MFRKFVLCLTTVVFAAGLLWAHGDPILGTVTAVDREMVTIKDKNSNVVRVKIDGKTKYLMGTKAANRTDVKVGAKVAIDAAMDTKIEMYVAESITLPADGSETLAATPPAPAKKP